MDWLMGKARGVSRGFMHAPTTIVSSPITEPISITHHSPCISPNGTPPVSTSNMSTETDSRRSPVHIKECTESESRNSVAVRLRAPSPLSVNVQTSRLTSKCSQSPGVSSETENYVDSKTLMYMKNAYVSQLLPIFLDSSYPKFCDVVEPFPSMDGNEWLAAHTIALFDNISTIYDAIYELCDCRSLRESIEDLGIQNIVSSLLMEISNSPFGIQSDDDRSKKNKGIVLGPTSQYNRISARQAIDGILSSCHDLIHCPRLFPIRNGEQFPPDLPQYVSVICKNILVCIVHMYVAHFNHLDQLELIPHMNTLARHFFAFTKRFSLVDDKQLDALACFSHTAFNPSS
ncbi:hypothetical protein MN116_001571 [Schistosoma mekongi]|uniref:Uncharacterized protein n=1 Tax=Schistosoma mekongi TaxID=38744 RepID=A0AAE2D7J4_SCHME|nr:hypothetical protein MN116_001571 [Schistosoma mekongi]